MVYGKNGEYVTSKVLRVKTEKKPNKEKKCCLSYGLYLCKDVNRPQPKYIELFWEVSQYQHGARKTKDT